MLSGLGGCNKLIDEWPRLTARVQQAVVVSGAKGPSPSVSIRAVPVTELAAHRLLLCCFWQRRQSYFIFLS